MLQRLFLQSNPRHCPGTSSVCGFPHVHVLRLTQFFFWAGMLEVGNPERESLKCVYVYVKQTVATSLESFDLILWAC